MLIFEIVAPFRADASDRLFPAETTYTDISHEVVLGCFSSRLIMRFAAGTRSAVPIFPSSSNPRRVARRRE